MTYYWPHYIPVCFDLLRDRLLVVSRINSHHLFAPPWLGSQADKRYQLADWRVRPLSPQHLHYARTDTHYLLYIYDRIKAELVEAGDQVHMMRIPEVHMTIPSSLLYGRVGIWF